jgi:hypothetical protein
VTLSKDSSLKELREILKNQLNVTSDDLKLFINDIKVNSADESNTIESLSL